MRIDRWVTANIDHLDPSLRTKRSKSANSSKNTKDEDINEYDK